MGELPDPKVRWFHGAPVVQGLAMLRIYYTQTIWSFLTMWLFVGTWPPPRKLGGR